VALGGAIEVVQHLTGWRHGDWADWVADAVGIILMALGARAVDKPHVKIVTSRWSLMRPKKQQ